MRVTKGLFRLWVVASVLWVLFAGAMTWQMSPVDGWVPVWAVEDEDITWDKPASDTRACDEDRSSLPDAPWVKLRRASRVLTHQNRSESASRRTLTLRHLLQLSGATFL